MEKLKGHSIKEMRNFYTIVTTLDQTEGSHQKQVDKFLKKKREIGKIAVQKGMTEKSVAEALGIPSIEDY